MYRSDLKNMREALHFDLNEELDTYLQSIPEQVDKLTPEIEMYPSAIRANYVLDCPNHLYGLVLCNVRHELRKVYPRLDAFYLDWVRDTTEVSKLLLCLSYPLLRCPTTTEGILTELKTIAPTTMYKAVLEREEDLVPPLTVHFFMKDLEQDRIPEVLSLIEKMKHDIRMVNGFTLRLEHNARVLSKEYDLNLPEQISHYMENDPLLKEAVKYSTLSYISESLNLHGAMYHYVKIEYNIENNKVKISFRKTITD
jgi:hypothetical protein